MSNHYAKGHTASMQNPRRFLKQKKKRTKVYKSMLIPGDDTNQ